MDSLRLFLFIILSSIIKGTLSVERIVRTLDGPVQGELDSVLDPKLIKFKGMYGFKDGHKHNLLDVKLKE